MGIGGREVRGLESGEGGGGGGGRTKHLLAAILHCSEYCCGFLAVGHVPLSAPVVKLA